jgi:hypothetical protein
MNSQAYQLAQKGLHNRLGIALPGSRSVRDAVSTTLKLTVLCAMVGCRPDSTTNTDVPTGNFGQPGSGYTAQCSGWFPDWISQVPPGTGDTDFQMSQGYYLGVPVIQNVNGQPIVTSYNRPADATVADAPWLAFDFHASGQQLPYLNALLQYVLQGNADAGFIIAPEPFPSWFNVPMMTTSGNRREPFHGLTRERTLFHSDWSWITGSNSLRSYAVGYYNTLGSYTLAQVFKDKNPALADPSQASFVNGTLVFKILFSEYAPAKIDAGTYPLTHAPEWVIQDASNPAAANNIHVRLIQMDIAVKDPRSVTGWVFATYDYDDSLTDPSPWKRLTAVGMMWGDDPTVTTNGQPLTETWLNPGLPSALKTHIGVNGRLIGPVDNPASSCISCHSTAQVDQGITQASGKPASAFTGAATIVPAACNASQRSAWFRDLPTGTAFGTTDGNGAGCNVVATPGGTNLYALDNSLQLQVGLISALYYANPNPCAGVAAAEKLAPQSAPSALAQSRRSVRSQRQQVAVDAQLIKALTHADESAPRR